MDERSNQRKSVELLQQLGLKEYEAKCFVALVRLPKGTAKEISETSDVPRTRVYDAIRVLETKGLVEVQHSNPQQFRAVPIAEAVELLRQEYESRTAELGAVLEDVEPAGADETEEIAHEVWSLTGSHSIKERTEELVGTAVEEVVLVLGDESAFTEELADRLRERRDAGCNVTVGTASDTLGNEVSESLPGVEVFTSGLGWLSASTVDPDDRTVISRLLLVDGETILVSSFNRAAAWDNGAEKAVFGRGFENGIVVITRRIMATGLGRDDGTTTVS